MTNQQTTKLIRLISAISDMDSSIHAADCLIAGVSDNLYEHLFLAMVVAYNRPFTKNYGVGRIQCDYPRYPDFGDEEMSVRHSRMVDLRNKFLAHSSAEGTRIQIVPSGVRSKPGSAHQAVFDFKIGKLVFPDVRYVKWLKIAPVAFKDRLHADIRQLLSDLYGDNSQIDAPFELPTGHENFKWA